MENQLEGIINDRVSYINMADERPLDPQREELLKSRKIASKFRQMVSQPEDEKKILLGKKRDLEERGFFDHANYIQYRDAKKKKQKDLIKKYGDKLTLAKAEELKVDLYTTKIFKEGRIKTAQKTFPSTVKSHIILADLEGYFLTNSETWLKTQILHYSNTGVAPEALNLLQAELTAPSSRFYNNRNPQSPDIPRSYQTPPDKSGLSDFLQYVKFDSVEVTVDLSTAVKYMVNHFEGGSTRGDFDYGVLHNLPGIPTDESVKYAYSYPTTNNGRIYVLMGKDWVQTNNSDITYSPVYVRPTPNKNDPNNYVPMTYNQFLQRITDPVTSSKVSLEIPKTEDPDKRRKFTSKCYENEYWVIETNPGVRYSYKISYTIPTDVAIGVCNRAPLLMSMFNIGIPFREPAMIKWYPQLKALGFSGIQEIPNYTLGEYLQRAPFINMYAKLLTRIRKLMKTLITLSTYDNIALFKIIRAVENVEKLISITDIFIKTREYWDGFIQPLIPNDFMLPSIETIHTALSRLKDLLLRKLPSSAVDEAFSSVEGLEKFLNNFEKGYVLVWRKARTEEEMKDIEDIPISERDTQMALDYATRAGEGRLSQAAIDRIAKKLEIAKLKSLEKQGQELLEVTGRMKVGINNTISQWLREVREYQDRARAERASLMRLQGEYTRMNMPYQDSPQYTVQLNKLSSIEGAAAGVDQKIVAAELIKGALNLSRFNNNVLTREVLMEYSKPETTSKILREFANGILKQKQDKELLMTAKNVLFDLISMYRASHPGEKSTFLNLMDTCLLILEKIIAGDFDSTGEALTNFEVLQRTTSLLEIPVGE